jgi:flagellar biosynthesis component FlhA
MGGEMNENYRDLSKEVLSIEIGKNYIKSVNKIIETIGEKRKEIRNKNNIEVPPIRIIDGSNLSKNSYRISIYGNNKCQNRSIMKSIKRLVNDLGKVIENNREIISKLKIK